MSEQITFAQYVQNISQENIVLIGTTLTSTAVDLKLCHILNIESITHNPNPLLPINGKECPSYEAAFHTKLKLSVIRTQHLAEIRFLSIKYSSCP